MIGFWIWPALVVVGLVLLGYLAYRLIDSRDPLPRGGAGLSARQILDLRFARGDIDEDEYRRRREQLR